MRLGSFASAEATTGFALWIPTTFEKVDETLSVFALLLLIGSLGFVQSCDRGGLLSLGLQHILCRRPNKNKNPHRLMIGTDLIEIAYVVSSSVSSVTGISTPSRS